MSVPFSSLRGRRGSLSSSTREQSSLSLDRADLPSTTWVAEIFYANVPPHTPKPTPDTATRAGSLALLVFAIVALGAGSLLPFLSTLGRRPFMQPYTTAATPVGRATRAVLTLMTPRNFWTVGLAMYGLLMIATFFTDTVGGAMVIIALLGVPWAVNCWVSPSSCKDSADALVGPLCARDGGNP